MLTGRAYGKASGKAKGDGGKASVSIGWEPLGQERLVINSITSLNRCSLNRLGRAGGAGTDREALLLGCALEDALLDKLKGGAGLALHAPQASVPDIRIIEAAPHRLSLRQ